MTLLINNTEYLAEEVVIAIANRQPTRVTVTNLMISSGDVVLENPGEFSPAALTLAGETHPLVLRSFRRSISGGKHANTVELVPAGLHLLSKLAYFQLWRSRQDDNPATVERTGFVVLNQDEAGANIDVETQLQDVFSAAATLYPGAPSCAINGGDWRAVKLPESEDRNLTCCQALMNTLRYFPKVFVRDAFADAGVVVGDEAGEWTAQPSRFLTDDTTEGDTDIAKVNVEFIRNGQAEGRPWFFVQRESAQRAGADPATLPLKTMDGTFMFNGPRFTKSRTSLDAKTMDIPPDLYDKAFWRALCPALFDGILDQDITIEAPARSGSLDAAQYPRIAVDTSLPELLGVVPELRARSEMFGCKASIIRRDGNDVTGHETEIPVQVPVVTTNAETQRYEWTTGWESEGGDAIPVGLAQQLLDTAPTSGVVAVSFDLLDPAHPLLPKIGETFRGLPCQSVQVAASTMVCTAVFSSAPSLDMRSLAELMTRFRRRATASYSRKTRETGELDGGVDIRAGAVAPRYSGQSGRGQRRVEKFKGSDDEAKVVTINPDDIGSEENKAAKMREVEFTAADGTRKKAHILSTEPEDAGEPVEKHLPQSVFYEEVAGSSGVVARLIQKKLKWDAATRGYIVDDAAEPDVIVDFVGLNTQFSQ